MAGQKVDRVVPGPVQLLGDLGNTLVELTLAAAEQTRVGHVLDECMVERHRLLVAARVDAVQESVRDEAIDRASEVGKLRPQRRPGVGVEPDGRLPKPPGAHSMSARGRRSIRAASTPSTVGGTASASHPRRIRHLPFPWTRASVSR